MKEYIEKQSLIKFFDNIRQPQMPITEGFKFITVDSIIEYLSKQPHADVVERSKIDKAIEEINDAPVLFVDFPLGKEQFLGKDVVLAILKRNIGE